MTEKNIEYQLLLQFADDLTQLIQHNVVSVSSKLFVKGLVAKDVHDSVLSVDGASNQSKAAKLLSCVLDKIKESGDQCQHFIDVLGEDSYFDNIVLKITTVHETLQACKDDTVESEERKQVIDSEEEIQQIKDRDKEEVGKQIKCLEKTFLSLKKKLLKELKADKEVTTEVLLESLSILPTELQTEYAAYLEEKLPVLEELGTVSKIFSRLSLHFTFLDYALLQHLIDEFGSEHLKQDMSSYDGEIQVFLDETTIVQLQDHLPGRQELPPHFDKLQMRIDKDPGRCSLRMVNDLRKRFCNETQLSEIIFVLIGIGKANSFIILFMVPSILGPRLVESVRGVDDSFCQRECIVSIALNQHQLYLAVALRERKDKYQKRLLELCASSTGDIQELRYILNQPGVDPNIYDQDEITALHIASWNGHKEAVQLLLERGASMDKADEKYGMTALAWAASEGHEQVVDVLLKAGANPDIQDKKYGMAALAWAAQNDRKQTVDVMLKAGVNPNLQNEKGATALHLASEIGSKEVVELVLGGGADVDKRDKNCGMTALTWAAYEGHEQVVDVLLKAGANPDVQDKKYGATTLAWAASKGHKQVVDVLLKAGASPDIQDHEGLTALMEATRHSYKDIVKSLLEKKANPNITEKVFGAAALYHAAVKFNGNAEIIRMLLDAGADVEIKDKYGLTAHDVASINSHTAVCQLLEQYGYKSSSRHDPVTSLQTFRDILEHGSELTDTPKHQESHTLSEQHSYDEMLTVS